LNVLHENGYDIGKAALSLITANGPVLCKDEIEDWSAAEANLFEDALEKYGKDFNEIRKDYVINADQVFIVIKTFLTFKHLKKSKLPWKSLKSIIEYYYTWKTTDRYVQRKSIKSAEQESKLKQVYIPNQ
jgi:metastasis-associated protein MTA